MQDRVDRDRRGFIAAMATATLAAAASSACSEQPAGVRGLRFASLAEAAVELERLGQAPALASTTDWSWARTLVHCAQSIEYSMIGYPTRKSMLFQRTIGAAAYGAFAWRGRMSHDLAEPIPGAPALEAAPDKAAASARLRQALHAFSRWPAALRPHFAYGLLDKTEYELAHAMHLADHFSAFRALP
ncbi:MAG: DUF1569 domain-containing protein [Lysobacteraceae bacterium]|nr:MAG: DUF1569 domain-containing protein [Xanthomonadaceae bacterium]